LQSTGALDGTVRLIEDLVVSAKGALDPSLITPQAMGLLVEMADLVAVRRL
jgi:hypothetical protein